MTTYTWTGQITFTGAVDPMSTNTATLTITPQAGESTIPGVINGTPGLPPTIRNVNVTQVPYGDTVPSSYATVVTPGGAGTASVYDLNIYVVKGQQGSPGASTNISAAPDVSGTPADTFTLNYDSATSKFKISAVRRPVGPYVVLNSSFNAAYSGTAGAYVVASIGVPAQPYAWRPVVEAALYCGGTLNTKVDLMCRLNNSSTGDVVGYGLGQTGIGPYPVVAGPSFGASIATGTYGQVAAGATATIFLIAAQTNSTTDTWTTLNTNGRFSVMAVPS